ncbi:hypothetical protein MMC31_002333 [Peltigera leucophlebia]|nr:hypothetical protein [Peltigera leucophlebia]
MKLPYFTNSPCLRSSSSNESDSSRLNSGNQSLSKGKEVKAKDELEDGKELRELRELDELEDGQELQGLRQLDELEDGKELRGLRELDELEDGEELQELDY